MKKLIIAMLFISLGIIANGEGKKNIKRVDREKIKIEGTYNPFYKVKLFFVFLYL